MAAVDLCTFNHRLGIYIRIVSLIHYRNVLNYVFVFQIDNFSAQVLKIDIYRHILVDDIHV
jgi:hypothetical protein